MSSFKPILKNLSAIFTSNVISVLTELVQPAIFLHGYSKALYADWIVLSSAVSYLATLNFGLQTYVNQDLTIRYNRGEDDSFHVQQSTALRALVATGLLAAAGCLVLFVIPVEKIFGLSLGHWAAATALYFISLQILMGTLIYSYFAGTFMVVGLAHRGNNWNNAQRFSNAVVLCTLAFLHKPLTVLAFGQFAVYLVLLTFLLIDLKRTAPDIFPTMRYWDGPGFRHQLHKSAYYALLFSCNYLGYEVPLILLRRFAGADPVVIFFIGRKIFSFGRQILTGLTQSMGPEITRLFGQEDWVGLHKLYEYSERVIFALITAVNVPLFVFSPILLHIWLHKQTGLFDLKTYLLLAATAIVICVKEHKQQFQISTNTHIILSRVTFGGYVAMAIVSIPAIHFFGLPGLVSTWLVTELYQAAAIIYLNRRLFVQFGAISTADVPKLAALSIGGLAVGCVLLRQAAGAGWSLQERISTNLVEVVVLMGAAYWAFHIQPLTGFLTSKIRGRMRPEV
jgi:O-antigen/teichoic acid export membrane protein